MLEQIISLIAPHSCVGCGVEDSLFCAECAGNLSTLPSRCYRCKRLIKDSRTCPSCYRQAKLWSVYAAVQYSDPAIKELIHRLKYERARAGADDISLIISKGLRPLLMSSKPTLVTHVPTATSRIRQRGYDQAELIAKKLAALLELPYVPLLLRTNQQRQVGQSGSTRRLQLAQSFRPRNMQLWQGADILVVDDVMTTGATLEAVAISLRNHGAKRVRAAVLAQA